MPVLLALAVAAALDAGPLQTALEKLAENFDGRVGICVHDQRSSACIQSAERFSLQSVVNLVVGAAAMDAVDHRGWRLADPVLVHRQDLSLYVQPLAKLVTKDGYRTNIGDLIRRAIVDSDSAATDILIAKLGGPAQIQAFLTRSGITDMRIDRDERHLQTEIAGIQWHPEYVDAAQLEKAMNAVPDSAKAEAYHQYQKDPRDTATPAGMASFLTALAQGKLLSPASTAHLLDVMTGTVTFPDRLKAGVSGGWSLAHKTGTSGSWQGVTAATNDVGVITAPGGGRVAIVVFIGDSREPAARRAALMANATRAAIAHYR